MSDDKKQDDDEDLMSDFKDLFPEEGEEEASSDDATGANSDGSEALDELDAMLDDFEQNFDAAGGDSAQDEPVADDGADAPVLTDEVSGEAMSGGTDEERQLELDKDDLDLAMSEAPEDEVFDDAWGDEESSPESKSEPEPEFEPQEVEPAEAESDDKPVSTAQPESDHDPLSEVAEIAAGNAASSTALRQSESGGGMSRGMVWSVIAVMLVSLGVSGFAAWLALGVGGRLDKMDNTLKQLEAQLPAAGKGDTAAVSAMRTELRTLAARVNELAVVIEGPMSHLRESNEGALADIEQRLRKLEGGAPVAAAKPLVEKKPVAEKKSEVKPAAATKGGWAINLISLSDEKDADAELKRLKNLGVRAEKQRAVKDGKTWYRLQVRGFTSYEGAKAYIETVEKKAGVKNAWVAKD